MVIYLVAGKVWTFTSLQAGGQQLILHLEDGVSLPVDGVGKMKKISTVLYVHLIFASRWGATGTFSGL